MPLFWLWSLMNGICSCIWTVVPHQLKKPLYVNTTDN